MSERVFERANHHDGACFVAGFAATRSLVPGGANAVCPSPFDHTPVRERVFERVNHHGGACFVAGFAATVHWCPVEVTVVEHLAGAMVRQ
ncbi:MAG: hypothetical protein ACR2HQ_02605 [Ilumatobacteraceae bacterium]